MLYHVVIFHKMVKFAHENAQVFSDFFPIPESLPCFTNVAAPFPCRVAASVPLLPSFFSLASTSFCAARMPSTWGKQVTTSGKTRGK